MANIPHQLNRLRVFAAVRNHMLRYEECPNPSEIAPTVGLSLAAVSRHMRALNKADGLPLPISFPHHGYSPENIHNLGNPLPIDKLPLRFIQGDFA